MFWKKKKKELTEEKKKILERLEVNRQYVNQLQSDLNQGLIRQYQLDIRLWRVNNELNQIEALIREEDNTEVFDDMMGHPMEWAEDLFHFEDKAVKELEDNADPL